MSIEQNKWYFIRIDFGNSFEYYNHIYQENHVNMVLDDICNEFDLKKKYILDDIIIFDSDNKFEKNLECFEIKLKKELIETFQTELNNCNMILDEDKEVDNLKNQFTIFNEFNLDNKTLIKSIEKSGIDANINIKIDKIIVKSKDEKNLIDTTKIQKLIKLIKDNIEKDFKESLDELNIELFKKKEILFSFSFESDNKTKLIDELLQNQNIKLYEISDEVSLLEEIDYNPKFHSDNCLIHNIRKRNILIGKYNTIGIDLFIAGHMNIKESKIMVTIKAFEYQILEKIINYLKGKLSTIKLKGNLSWERLMSRLVDSGYRKWENNIINNRKMENFLKESKKDNFSEKFKFIMKNILVKGYFEEDQFEKISKESSLAKFFLEYIKIDKNHFNDKSFWVNNSTGVLYREKPDKNDPERIELGKYRKIYAPEKHLLHYIRAFWHQLFVEDIFKKIKKEWESNSFNLQIINIKNDLQFDFLNENPNKSTKDIDILIRVKNNKKNREFIVGIEAKRNSKEYIQESNQIPKKIELEYVNMFDGFIFVGYFDDINSENAPDKSNQVVIWEREENENIVKPFLLCSDCSFKSLVDQIKKLIINIGDNCG